LPDLAAKFQTVFSGHHDVEQKQRRTLALGIGHDQIAGRVQAHVEAGPFQMMANQAGNIRVIFHYIDRRLHATIVAGKCVDSIKAAEVAFRGGQFRRFI
jgi:hypothetical protein